MPVPHHPLPVRKPFFQPLGVLWTLWWHYCKCATIIMLCLVIASTISHDHHGAHHVSIIMANMMSRPPHFLPPTIINHCDFGLRQKGWQWWVPIVRRGSPEGIIVNNKWHTPPSLFSDTHFPFPTPTKGGGRYHHPSSSSTSSSYHYLKYYPHFPLQNISHDCLRMMLKETCQGIGGTTSTPCHQQHLDDDVLVFHVAIIIPINWPFETLN